MPKNWSAQQEAHLRKLFKEDKVPFRKEGNKPIKPTIIKQIFEEHPIFQTGYTLKNFYPLFRHKAAEWLCNETKTGQRASKLLLISSCLCPFSFSNRG